MLLLASALGLGFLHGLGADHLMAITALSIGPGTDRSPGPARALRVAVRFACGHAVLLALGALVGLLVGWTIPPEIDRGGELAAGMLLVTLGGVGLWAVATRGVYAHRHAHGDPAHVHWHVHVGRPEHHPRPSAHSHVPLLLGAVFAVSSLRALAMLAPFGGGTAASPLLIAALIVIFGAGILLSMSLFGILLAGLMSTRLIGRMGRAATAITSLASLLLGGYWVLSSL